MSQKVISNFASNAEDISYYKKLTIQQTNRKNLDQAVHNVLLGMELISVVENAYEEITSLLSQVKYWVYSSLKSNSENPQISDLETRIFLKLKVLDQAAETFKHKGQKFLDGSMSASAKTDSHSFLVVGANGSPENRINLNTSLNIPSISSNTLGLGELSISSSQTRLKGLMMVENALAITTRLKQRSTALGTHLQGVNQHLSTAIENHHAANTTLDFFRQTGECSRVVTDFIKKNKGQY
jgi:flagellin-like hook-associated protein FlgL